MYAYNPKELILVGKGFIPECSYLGCSYIAVPTVLEELYHQTTIRNAKVLGTCYALNARVEGLCCFGTFFRDDSG